MRFPRSLLYISGRKYKYRLDLMFIPQESLHFRPKWPDVGWHFRTTIALSAVFFCFRTRYVDIWFCSPWFVWDYFGVTLSDSSLWPHNLYLTRMEETGRTLGVLISLGRNNGMMLRQQEQLLIGTACQGLRSRFEACDQAILSRISLLSYQYFYQQAQEFVFFQLGKNIITSPICDFFFLSLIFFRRIYETKIFLRQPFQ